MVNWRKALRAIHRDLGYACVGLTLVYAISGIAVNHVHEWNPNYEISRVQSNIGPVAHEVPVSEDTVSDVLTRLGLPTVHKTTFQPDPDSLQIIQDQTSILVDLNTGDTLLKRIATRPVLYESNVLHLNRPKSIWTWVADLFAVALVFLAISGMLILKGRQGLLGRGLWFTLLGIAIPAAALLVYL